MIESPLQKLYRRLFKPGPWRFFAAGRRALPDFLVIGAMRSGTTSLYDTLCRHARILPAIKKEIHFFDLEFGRGLPWYRAHFPTRARLDWKSALTGEASPYYLAHPLAPGRAAETVPHARLVAILRDPVERAYSHYWHSVRLGVETLDFEAALDAEPDRLAGEEDRLAAEPGYRSRAHQHLAYAGRSRYADQLARWLAHFPREQLLVLEQRRFQNDPAGQAARLFAFLGLDPQALPVSRPLNRAQYPRLDPAVRARLAASFRPHNDRLFELLGESFDWAA